MPRSEPTPPPDFRARLPEPKRKLWLDGALAPYALRPWFDRVLLRWVCKTYFPLSRGWAAARWADGDVDALRAELARCGVHKVSGARLARLASALPKAERAYQAAMRGWYADFHAQHRPADAHLVASERQRERAAQRLMAQRARVVPVHRRTRLPAAAFDIRDAAAVEAAHGGRAEGRVPAFPAPARPEARRTHAVPGPDGAVSWVDWPAPMAGVRDFPVDDRVRARVVEPEDRPDAPTLIHLHGIGMEPEMLVAQREPVLELARRHGIRVVRPEGPWHGSRMAPGFWGGEPALAHAPLGWLDLVQAWVGEVAQLIAWARATSNGPVAIGGLSLGALNAQVAATAARAWPAEMQPDALFLCMTSGDMLQIGFEGAMAKGLGALQAVRAAGWDHDALTRFRPLLEPQEAPVMPASRIVMHLGRLDAVMPVDGGRALARRWGVPERNLFEPWRGHFTAPLALHIDPGPLDRLAMILNRL
ncbi:hypothetical protein [Rhodovibrio salinarum]|uniref:Alpha/beta hydrolase family protein n=1 Tax=Rhodovibrio salinarum TaxID=1087 RepID=A0A934QIF6_9PROT|nr:hypothetical protein [Rhodovibrio salinarum]MBK1697621.1 hypothetical protein [Rhodovibrio salinarum]